MTKTKKVAAEKKAAPVEKKKVETAESYVATAAQHGCPVLDIISLLAEGFQAWRHGKSVALTPHKEN